MPGRAPEAGSAPASRRLRHATLSRAWSCVRLELCCRDRTVATLSAWMVGRNSPPGGAFVLMLFLF